MPVEFGLMTPISPQFQAFFTEFAGTDRDKRAIRHPLAELFIRFIVGTVMKYNRKTSSKSKIHLTGRAVLPLTRPSLVRWHRRF